MYWLANLCKEKDYGNLMQSNDCFMCLSLFLFFVVLVLNQESPMSWASTLPLNYTPNSYYYYYYFFAFCFSFIFLVLWLKFTSIHSKKQSVWRIQNEYVNNRIFWTWTKEQFRYCSAKTYQMERLCRRQVEGLIGNFLCHGIYYCPGYISEY